METLEDNIVQHKLSSLDTLPEGYTPNLESKWSMLEAGFDGNKKRIVAWKPIAAAALLLFLGGAALLLQQIKPQAKATAGQLNPTVVIAQTVPKTTTPIPQKAPVLVKPGSIKPPTQQPRLVARMPEVSNKIWEVELPAVVEQPQESQVFANTPVVKLTKQQFVEIDFNDVPPSRQYIAEPAIAFRPLKFTIGPQTNTSTNDDRYENALRLQKNF
ncbi:MAG: hypothetical protein V4590_00270 [Bacteroidota bacterium]